MRSMSSGAAKTKTCGALSTRTVTGRDPRRSQTGSGPWAAVPSGGAAVPSELNAEIGSVRTALRRLAGASLLAVVWAATTVAPAHGAAGSVRASTSSTPRWPLVEVVQTTADRSLKLARLTDLSFTVTRVPAARVIEVQDTVRDQSMIGVGGALTDSSAWLIAHALSPAGRTALMNHLFGARGDRLSFAVVPMGASDFTHTGRPYSYDDLPAGQSDPALSRFSIGHDLPYIIPVLRQALALNPQLRLFAVPWSPPSWMKATTCRTTWPEACRTRSSRPMRRSLPTSSSSCRPTQPRASRSRRSRPRTSRRRLPHTPR